MRFAIQHLIEKRHFPRLEQYAPDAPWHCTACDLGPPSKGRRLVPVFTTAARPW